MSLSLDFSSGVGGSIELVRQVLDASLDGICAFDRDLRYVYWNGVMERIYGLRAHEVLGQKASLLLPFIEKNGEEQRMREALEGRRSRVREAAFDMPDTSLSGFVESHYMPLYTKLGDIAGGVGVVRDITARKQTELLVRETETRFFRMADSSPVLLWMAGTDGLCNFFNQTWLDFTGRPLSEEFGVGWAEGVHPFDFQRCMDT
jgi:PAS domain S-box-containing protein